MKKLHTPGPWSEHPHTMESVTVKDENTGGAWVHHTVVIGSGLKMVANAQMTTPLNDIPIGGWPEVDNEPELQANAKLIIAAPELLKALENLVFTASKLWDDVKSIKDGTAITVTHPIIEEAKEIIKKATE